MEISKDTKEEATTSAKTPSAVGGDKERVSRFPTAMIGDRPTGTDSDDEEETGGGETFTLSPTDRSRKKFFDEKASFFSCCKMGSWYSNDFAWAYRHCFGNFLCIQH